MNVIYQDERAVISLVFIQGRPGSDIGWDAAYNNLDFYNFPN
jgi:hypothetical protein